MSGLSLDIVEHVPTKRVRINSRAKGKRGELQARDLLRESGWPNARRGQQRSGVDQADVIDGPARWHIEVKNVEQLNLWRAYAQALHDAPPNCEPVVLLKRNASPWLALVDARVFLSLLRAHEDRVIADLLA